jgi:hypothetical protein
MDEFVQYLYSSTIAEYPLIGNKAVQKNELNGKSHVR